MFQCVAGLLNLRQDASGPWPIHFGCEGFHGACEVLPISFRNALGDLANRGLLQEGATHLGDQTGIEKPPFPEAVPVKVSVWLSGACPDGFTCLSFCQGELAVKRLSDVVIHAHRQAG